MLPLYLISCFFIYDKNSQSHLTKSLSLDPDHFVFCALLLRFVIRWLYQQSQSLSSLMRERYCITHQMKHVWLRLHFLFNHPQRNVLPAERVLTPHHLEVSTLPCTNMFVFVLSLLFHSPLFSIRVLSACTTSRFVHLVMAPALDCFNVHFWVWLLRWVK